MLELQQGTPEWLAARAQHDCASDAPAMMGASKYETRNALLKRRATGVIAEIDSGTQYLFDKGHAAEAAIRPYIESLIGDELYPAVGVEGTLLASFDGITMGEEVILEHKLWSEAAAAQVRAKELGPEYYWQVEHQLLVSKAGRCIFVVSDGTPERCVHMWYKPVAGRAKALQDGWAQFREDLAAYQPQATALAVVAEAVEALPAVSVRMDGAIAVISNLELFGDKLKAYVAGIDRKPDTDQGFANCEAAVKTLKQAEDALEAAETAALAQIDPVEAMRRTVANYRDIARTTRLALEKVVKYRKDEIRTEIQQKARAAWDAHVRTINTRLRRVSIRGQAPDFGGAMKGKKTLESLRGAVDDVLAKAKIEANQEAEDVAANLKTIDELTSAAPAGLFRDLQDLVTINPEHLAGVIRGRLAEHEAAEAKRLEAERARIRQEEEARAQRTAEAERARIAAEERAKIQAEAKPAPTSEPQSVPVQATRQPAFEPGTAPVPAKARKATQTRPTDDQIIEALALHYRVHEMTVIGWLLDMDVEAASARSAKEFS